MYNHFPKQPCETCLKPMPSYRHYKRFCGETCRQINKGTYVQPNKLERMCEICFKSYFTTRNSQKYCSIECLKKSQKDKIEFNKNNFSIFHRDNFRCIYCGKSSIEDGVKLEVEHVAPIKLGGLTIKDNLITSCHDCNKSKTCTPLDHNIKLRILQLIRERNKKLSLEQLSIIEIQISEINHDERVRRLVKRVS